jgi:hypothetical protein
VSVWIPILASFLVGAAVKSLPHKSGAVVATGWGVIVVAVSAYFVLSDTSLAVFESFAAVFAGSLAAFFTGYALVGLIRDWRNRSARPS